MFALEIEYLNGVSYAAKNEKNHIPEWPPHPDRIFMALIDAWGETKEVKEADALRWLEKQEPPDILFPSANPRQIFQNFVPTSSNATKGQKYFQSKSIYQITSSIKRKPRYFPASILPDNEHTVYAVWEDVQLSKESYDVLLSVVKRVYRIGHSASLVRMNIKINKFARPSNIYTYDEKNGSVFLRCPYSGRFDELTDSFENNTMKEDSQWRPNIAITRGYRNPHSRIIQSKMSSDWVILSCKGFFTNSPNSNDLHDKVQHVPSFTPDIRVFPHIAKKMRDMLMSYIRPESIHEVISGHSTNGTVLQKPHLAILPLANVGWQKFSDGRLLGVALVLPRDSTYGTVERRQLKQAISKFLENNSDVKKQSQSTENGILNVSDIGKLKFSNTNQDRSSLSPDRYVSKSKSWNTVTPLILDHYPKKNKKPEDIVRTSCENVGLPKPISVHISRHSNVIGVPPAFISEKGWRSPKKGLFDNRFVCHASLSFSEDVEGPIILGAGRYYGLGLFIKDRGDG